LIALSSQPGTPGFAVFVFIALVGTIGFHAANLLLPNGLAIPWFQQLGGYEIEPIDEDSSDSPDADL
jgi:hypothetical protein